MRQDGGRPVDRMDLRHQRRVDQLGLAIELLVVPFRVLVLEQIADVVVLLREQGVEHRQADPPVVAEAGEVRTGLRIHRQQPGRLEPQLAADVSADLLRGRGVAAVDLRRVPPVAVQVGVGRRPGRTVRAGSRSVLRTLMVGSPKSSPGWRRNLEELGLRVLVHEPVVHLELNPRRRQQVQDRRRLELLAGHQLAADGARVGHEQVGGVRTPCARAGSCGRSAGRRSPFAGPPGRCWSRRWCGPRAASDPRSRGSAAW